jgi:hypothetical protein
MHESEPTRRHEITLLTDTHAEPGRRHDIVRPVKPGVARGLSNRFAGLSGT